MSTTQELITDSPAKRMKYVQRDIDRFGEVRYYFVRRRQPKVRLPSSFGSEDFEQAYAAALRGERAPMAHRPCIVCGGCFAALSRSHRMCSEECRNRRKWQVKQRSTAPKEQFDHDAIWSRLVANSQRNPDTGCLEWTKHRTKDGYGVIYTHGKHVNRVHRLAYQIKRGPIPDGLVVRHMCDNPRCLEIDHLELGTQKQNSEDRLIRGKISGKLSREDAAFIKRKLTEGAAPQDLATAFGVSGATISNIKNNRTWKLVNPEEPSHV